jgi:hypothetical protein
VEISAISILRAGLVFWRKSEIRHAQQKKEISQPLGNLPNFRNFLFQEIFRVVRPVVPRPKPLAGNLPENLIYSDRKFLR